MIRSSLTGSVPWLSMVSMVAPSRTTVIDQDKEYAVAEEYREKLKIKTPTVEQLVGNLSGGNQQKVLLAKWMFKIGRASCRERV